MTSTDIVIVAILGLILGFAIFYIYKSKKSGKKCIGCPDGCCSEESCQKCSCNCDSKEK